MPDPTVAERHTRDQAVMAELRGNGGRMKSGLTLVILTVAGTRSGREYHKPVCVREDGPDLVVAASAGGQRLHPQWYRNLVANPDITVEYLGETFAARASTEPNGPDRDRLFQMMSTEIVGLYGYQDRCRDSRQIPIVRLSARHETTS
jgi:deazaflavin-dependent oxidoreductase (nitroreductase family)